MKKLLAILLCTTLLATLFAGSLLRAADVGDEATEPVAVDAGQDGSNDEAAGEPTANDIELDPGDTSEQQGETVMLDFVRFTATGNDPYGTFHFKADGENTTIDPDEVVWAAIRYRTISQYDSKGVEFSGQFYIKPDAEPCVPIHYTFSGEWETVVVDLTTVSQKTELESIWDSGHYINYDIVRFDPLEPDRDSEKTEADAGAGKVKKGDCIDVAWIAFFTDEYQARTYTGRENTPVAILDVEALLAINDPNKLLVSKLSEEAVLPTVAPATATPEPTATPAPTEVPTAAPATPTPQSNNTAAPTQGASNSNANSGNKDQTGPNVGLIIGIVVGVLAIAGIVTGVVLAKKEKAK